MHILGQRLLPTCLTCFFSAMPRLTVARDFHVYNPYVTGLSHVQPLCTPASSSLFWPCKPQINKPIDLLSQHHLVQALHGLYSKLKCCALAGSSQQHWPFPESHIGLGYAYILTHPGLPCVAWEHMWDPRHTFIITQLMAMRRRQDIHAGSKLEILCADRMMYVARIDNRWVNRGWLHMYYCTQSMWLTAECPRYHYSQSQRLCL